MSNFNYQHKQIYYEKTFFRSFEHDENGDVFIKNESTLGGGSGTNVKMWGIRGQSGKNQRLELYDRVSIGFPNGWGSFPEPPQHGLYVHGGAILAGNSGSVGIGTSSPDDLLHVNGITRTNELRVVSGDMKLSIPSVDSDWARGLKYYSTSAFNTSQLGGIGLYGSNTILNRMYMTFGSSPWTSTKGIQILPSGNVGVGVVDPATPLFVSGTNNVEGPSISKVLAVADTNDSTKTISLGFDASNGVGVIASVDAGSNWLNTVIQPYGGSVGIGTTDTFGYKLAVNGNATFKNEVLAQDYRVYLFGSNSISFTSTPWPDYVFEDEYELMLLEEVEEHIEEKGHLPT